VCFRRLRVVRVVVAVVVVVVFKEGVWFLCDNICRIVIGGCYKSVNQ